MQTIGFIGLGKMGGNMAARYLAAAPALLGDGGRGLRTSAQPHPISR